MHKRKLGTKSMGLTVAMLMLVAFSGQLFAADPGTSKVFGKVHHYYKYDMTENAKMQSSFEISRAAFGGSYQISEDVKGKVTFDVDRINMATGASIGDDGSLKMKTDPRLVSYLKVAYIDWKNLIPMSTISFGQIGRYMFKVSEKHWGHRNIQKSSFDLAKFDNSADLGMAIAAKVHPMATIRVEVLNGEGYKKPQDSKGKHHMTGSLELKPVDGVTVFAFYGTKPDGGKTPKTETAVSLAYSKDGITALVDYGMEASNGGKKDADMTLISAVGRFQVNDALEVFGRFDQLASKKDWNAKKDGEVIIAGLEVKPGGNFKVSPNFQYHKNKVKDSKPTQGAYINMEWGF